MTSSYYFHNASNDLRRAVWTKGQIIQGWDPNVWRHDACGHVMKFDQHGETSSHGWEIDHVLPRAKGGSTELSNLQPLYWENNRRKSDTYPWYCQNAA